VPGVVAVSGIRTARWHLGTVGKDVTGIDPVGGPQILTLHMVTGSSAALGRGEVLVDNTVAKNDHYRLGQILPHGLRGDGRAAGRIGGTMKAKTSFFSLATTWDRTS